METLDGKMKEGNMTLEDNLKELGVVKGDAGYIIDIAMQDIAWNVNLDYGSELVERETAKEKERIAKIHKTVAEAVQDRWSDLDGLAGNIDSLFRQYPSLSRYYEDYRTEVLDGVRKNYEESLKEGVHFLVKHADTLNPATTIGHEKHYEGLKRALRMLNNGKADPDAIIGQSLDIPKDKTVDQVVYGVLYDTTLRHLKALSEPNIYSGSDSDKAHKLLLASTKFEAGVEIFKVYLQRCAKKLGIEEYSKETAEPIIGMINKKIADARKDEKTRRYALDYADRLYVGMQRVVNAIKEQTNPLRFKRYYEKLRDMGHRYVDHIANYSAVLNETRVDAEMDIKNLQNQIKSNPSAAFLLWEYQHEKKTGYTRHPKPNGQEVVNFAMNG